MKKAAKLLITIALLLVALPLRTVKAETYTDNEKKERLLSYGMYASIRFDNKIEIKESIANQSYEIIHQKLEEEIIKKLDAKDEIIIWDPEFVLELAPIEFPELYNRLYKALERQGYNKDAGIIGTVTLESNNVARANSYTFSQQYVYDAAGHGTVIVCDNSITWSNTSSGYNITSVSGEVTGGWPMLDKSISKRNNNTSNAYGFYSYTTIESAYTYSANCQLQIIPSSNGTATLVLRSEGITSYGIGFASQQ